jgi:hypothetical protein
MVAQSARGLIDVTRRQHRAAVKGAADQSIISDVAPPTPADHKRRAGDIAPSLR